MGSQDMMTTAPTVPAAKSGGAPDGLNLESLRQVFLQFPDPVMVMNGSQRVVYLNDAAEALLGGADKTDGAPLWSDLFEARTLEGTFPFVERCLEGAGFNRVPFRLKNALGATSSLFLSANPLKDGNGRIVGCLVVFRDILADLMAQTEMKTEAATLYGIFENFPTPFFTVDSNLLVTYMNRHLEKLVGFTRSEVINKMTCSQVLSTVQCGTDACLLRQAMKDGKPITGVRRTIVDRAGRKIPVVVNSSIITDADGKIIGGFEAIRDITPIVEAEQKIEMLTELTQEGILMVNEHHRIVFANSRMADILRQPKERLVGLDVSEVLPPQHQKMMADLMRRVDEENQQQLSFCSTIQAMHAEKEDYRAFETCMAVSRIGKGVIACMYFFDLTKRIETERQLRNANSFLSNIIRSSVDGIVVVDTEANVLIFNEGAERILGYKAEEVIGHPEVFREFYDSEVARENMRRMRSEKHGPKDKLSTTRISFRRKDGEVVPVNFSAAIIKEGDREVGSVGIFSDMREHLRILRELEEAKIQLLQSEKIASLGRLSAGVAHEINNPLAGILIYADMLMKDVGDHAEWKADLEEIVNQTLRCKQIVTRLLEFSRQPLGERVIFSVNEVIDRCIELLGHQPLFHDIEFVRDLPDDVPGILGDPGQIQQVFTNLIINAANAMDGKGKLTVSSRFNEPSEEVVLKFADTGPGISPEIMDKIFEPFFTTKRPGEGTGLGLSVAYGIIQQHGGKIDVESMPGSGAVFSVVLPLISPEHMTGMMEE
jgi:PAS domain S-box-containing protein